MDSEDLPFKLIGGETKEVAGQNQVNAINRINYIVRKKIQDFDIRTKSNIFAILLDTELYKKYYQYNNNKTIDEDFCQKMAEACIDMEKDNEPPLST